VALTGHESVAVPEGDTVWLAARRLNEALAGRVLTASDLRVPSLATVDLTGRELLAVTSRGKHLLMRISGGHTLHSHFRMEGTWHLYRPDDRWHGGPMHTVRAILRTTDRVAVGYRLGELDLWATERVDHELRHLGPDVLDPDWDRAEALRRILSDPDASIADALRDQRNLAGLGNIYICESLFINGIDPFKPVRDVPDVAVVVDTACALIRRNAPRPSQATTGDERRPHYVHGRRRQPCWRCGTPIRARTAGPSGRGRWTYWCATCQT
jgi:endonuclease-8